jgi:hypothetical protein
VIAVARHNYSRPIVAAPDQLVAAVETCEQCHWPNEFHGDKIRQVYEYADDEKNTESLTTLQLHVGGGDVRRGLGTGIHWHMNLANAIEYVATDAARQTIPYIRVTDGQGAVREYIADGAKIEDFAGRPRRRMECVDCHNRPSHAIAATPERAVNEAMTRGEIPKTLPFVHREAVRMLKASYPSAEAGVREISRGLRNFYQSGQAQGSAAQPADVDKAVAAVGAIYSRSVFPDMNVTFGTYANNIGHIDSPGCFRCHDDNHKSKDGRKIGQDCDTCHGIQ